MKQIILDPLTINDFPSWINLDEFAIEKVKLHDNIEMEPWEFIDKNFLNSINKFVKNEYSKRQLFAFAARVDCDDIACFEKSKPGKIVIVHNWEVEDFEAGPEFVSFEAWYEYVKNVDNGDQDYDNIPGIDFYPE